MTCFWIRIYDVLSQHNQRELAVIYLLRWVAETDRHTAEGGILTLIQDWPPFAAADGCALVIGCEGLHFGLI